MEVYATMVDRAERFARNHNAMNQWSACTLAAEAEWLKLDPATRDQLEINLKNAEKK